MTKRTIETNDLAMHAQTLSALIQGVGVHGITPFDVIYIYDGQGNQITHARLEEETLTDGSTVYNLHLSAK